MDEEQRFAFDTWGFLTVEDALGGHASTLNRRMVVRVRTRIATHDQRVWSCSTKKKTTYCASHESISCPYRAQDHRLKCRVAFRLFQNLNCLQIRRMQAFRQLRTACDVAGF